MQIMAEVKKPPYKYCMVPKCKNTNRNTPDKVIFRIPSDAKIRKHWCKMIRDNVSGTEKYLSTQRKLFIMTSPAINKSPKKQTADNKSPTHSAENANQTPANAEGAATTPENQQSTDPFSWLRIFKLADLMMKQGC